MPRNVNGNETKLDYILALAKPRFSSSCVYTLLDVCECYVYYVTLKLSWLKKLEWKINFFKPCYAKGNLEQYCLIIFGKCHEYTYQVRNFQIYFYK